MTVVSVDEAEAERESLANGMGRGAVSSSSGHKEDPLMPVWANPLGLAVLVV